MEKWMCLGSIGVAALLLLLFLADLFTGFPFSNGTPGYDSPFMLLDIGGILAAGAIGYLGWNAWRDVK
jgi:hypothetical protein